MARAIYAEDYADTPWLPFDTLHPADQDGYRRMARAAVGAILPPLPRLTRVEVSMSGQLFKREHWADSWELSWQDDGRTLKLFGKGNGQEAQAERDAALIGEVNGDR